MKLNRRFATTFVAAATATSLACGSTSAAGAATSEPVVQVMASKDEDGNYYFDENNAGDWVLFIFGGWLGAINKSKVENGEMTAEEAFSQQIKAGIATAAVVPVVAAGLGGLAYWAYQNKIITDDMISTASNFFSEVEFSGLFALFDAL